MKRITKSIAGCLIAWASCCSLCRAQKDPKLDSLMFERPQFHLAPSVYNFLPRVTPLWVKALKRPEADLKKQASFSIIWAHQRDMDTKPFVAPLVANLADENLQVRLSSAKALIAIEAKAEADALFQALKEGGLEMAQLVEPVLGRWKHPEIRAVWRDRVRTPERAGYTLLAIRGLGELQDKESAGDLVRIASTRTERMHLRMAAADAAGRIASEGLEPGAEKLAARAGSSGVIDRLVAAKLLRRHDSPQALAVLDKLAADEVPSVAAIALRRQLEIDPKLVAARGESLVAKGDANVRQVVVRALAARPTDASIKMLGDLMADRIPKVRIQATEALLELAKTEELKPKVVAEGERMLDSAKWRAQEQSILLLTKLEQPQKRMEFIELLEHWRPEVYATAAWGLRHLAVDDTLEPVLKVAMARNKIRFELWESAGPNGAGIDTQLMQLNQLFGLKRYAPAEPYLRTFVAKDFEVVRARAAAIWALGYYYEGKPDAGLARQLSQRLADAESTPPEDEVVRRFAAISLGRMKAEQELATLRRFRGHGNIDAVGYACRVAIEWITGEPFDKRPKPVQKWYNSFFLEPLPTREQMQAQDRSIKE